MCSVKSQLRDSARQVCLRRRAKSKGHYPKDDALNPKDDALTQIYISSVDRSLDLSYGCTLGKGRKKKEDGRRWEDEGWQELSRVSRFAHRWGATNLN